MKGLRCVVQWLPSQRVKVPTLVHAAGNARVSTDNSVGPHLAAGHPLEQLAIAQTAIKDDQTRACTMRFGRYVGSFGSRRSLQSPPAVQMSLPRTGVWLVDRPRPRWSWPGRVGEP